MNTTATLTSYAALENLFSKAHLALTPAECHGLLTGILCVHPDPVFALSRLEELHTYIDPDAAEVEDLQEVIANIAETTLQQLADPEFGFHLILPETDALKPRAVALGEWTEAFISGLGEADFKFSGGADYDAEEMLQDLSAIAKINAADVTDTEEDEKSFTDLEEYLRMAAITFYTETLLKNTQLATNAPSTLMH